MSDHKLIARRLSAALGKKITVADIDRVDDVSDFTVVRLKSGEHVTPLAGAAAYLGDGIYFKNGREWDPDAEGVSPRWT